MHQIANTLLLLVWSKNFKKKIMSKYLLMKINWEIYFKISNSLHKLKLLLNLYCFKNILIGFSTASGFHSLNEYFTNIVLEILTACHKLIGVIKFQYFDCCFDINWYDLIFIEQSNKTIMIIIPYQSNNFTADQFEYFYHHFTMFEFTKYFLQQ